MAGTTPTTIKLKVDPSYETKHLAYMYTKAKREMVRWLAENKVTSNFREALHKRFYAKLKRMGLPLALIFDCYKDAKNTYKSWLGGESKKLPKARKVSVILTPGKTYDFNAHNISLSILGEETKILGYSILYYGEIAEARLLKKDNGWFVHITVRMKQKNVKPLGLVAVNINGDFIVVGNDKVVVEIPTRFYDAWHYVKVAEGLKKKYGKKFKHSKHILSRYKYFYKRAKSILVDSAKKMGKWAIDVALALNANVIALEKIRGLKMSKTSAMLFQYSRIQWWIEWQARKHGLKVIKVPPIHSSPTCPRCKAYMVETENRMVKCLNCGYEEDRDYMAVKNLYGRGRWLLSTALRKSFGKGRK